MEKSKLYNILFVSYLGLMAAGGIFWLGHRYQEGRFYTPWMSPDEMHAYLRPFYAKEADGKNYWDHGHWIEGVEGRTGNNRLEYRLRFGEAPRDGTYSWRWRYDANVDDFDQREGPMKKKGFVLIHAQSYRTPDDVVLHTEVWHKVDGRHARVSHPIPVPPAPEVPEPEPR